MEELAVANGFSIRLERDQQATASAPSAFVSTVWVDGPGLVERGHGLSIKCAEAAACVALLPQLKDHIDSLLPASSCVGALSELTRMCERAGFISPSSYQNLVWVSKGAFKRECHGAPALPWQYGDETTPR